MILLRTALSVLVLLCAACQGTRTLQDPLLEVRTPKGKELAVATDHGVLFLGRTAQSGEVELTAWYGDGPDIELAVVEPLGGGLFTAEPEIRVPSVPISFRVPKVGEQVEISGRDGANVWQEQSEIVSDPDITGLLLPMNNRLSEGADQVGAAVFRVNQQTELRELVGLVAGVVVITDAQGAKRRYVAVIGADQFWRLVTYRHEMPHKPRWVYREDIL